MAGNLLGVGKILVVGMVDFEVGMVDSEVGMVHVDTQVEADMAPAAVDTLEGVRLNMVVAQMPYFQGIAVTNYYNSK